MYRRKLGSSKFIIINIEYNDLNLICTNHSNKQQSFYDILMRYMQKYTHNFSHLQKKSHFMPCWISDKHRHPLSIVLWLFFKKKNVKTRKKGFALRLSFLKINKTTLLVCVGFCKRSFGCLGEDADVVQNVQKYSEFDRENIKNFPSSYSRCCWIFLFCCQKWIFYDDSQSYTPTPYLYKELTLDIFLYDSVLF